MNDTIKGQIALLNYIDEIILSCLGMKNFLSRTLRNNMLRWGNTEEYRSTHRLLKQHIDRLNDLSLKITEYPENVEPSQLLNEVEEIHRDATLAIVTIVRS